ncbi:DUF397 domain-containing protein [Streptomyces sp. NPDC017991]|uniref:DUF397 domain-containing protein n=1 Tax=Streptomyces sp. NPDC017991 TaxID=3365026 RepID=UPI003795C86B
MTWLKSSFSEASGNNCVEVAAADDGIALRESANPTEVLSTGAGALSALLRSVRSGPPGRGA